MDKHLAEQCRVEINALYHSDLTSKEAEVLALAAKGLDNASIASQLSITKGTVKDHFNHIFSKLDEAMDGEAKASAGKGLNKRVMVVKFYQVAEAKIQASATSGQQIRYSKETLSVYQVSPEIGGRSTDNSNTGEITPKSFRHPNLFWNPRGKPSGTELKHAMALRDISVSMSPEPPFFTAIDVTLCVRLVSKDWKSIGDDQAPWVHLDFFDGLGKEIAIDGSKNWAVMDFDFGEDRTEDLTRRIYTPRYDDITGVRVWLGAGYADQHPESPKERDLVGSMVFPIMQFRAFLSRFRRRLKRVFWVPKAKK